MGVAAVLLGASALFGGLNDAPTDPIPTLQTGESHQGTRLAVTVLRAVLIDGFPDQGYTPDDGDRFLMIVANVENVWHSPVTSNEGIGDADVVLPTALAGIEGGTAPDIVAVLNDGSRLPALQPRVPVELGYIWSVDADAFSDGDALRIDLLDEAYLGKGSVSTGDIFDDPETVAVVDVPITDLGTGETPAGDATDEPTDSGGSDG
jgi:hypothetical protein